MEGINSQLLAYISNYEGHSKLARLQFIGDKFEELRSDAGRLLLDEVSKGLNTAVYVKLVPKITDYYRINDFSADEAWVKGTEKKVQQRLEILEAELAAAKKAMVKESIRKSLNDIGHFYYQVGNLNEALKSFLRTRDFCTTANHNNEMCLNVMCVSLDLQQYFNVGNFLSKISDCSSDVVLSSKFKAVNGLLNLNDGSFRGAAFRFLDIAAPLDRQFASVISDEDIGLYGTICALASFNRSELRTYFVDRKGFLNAFTSLLPDLKALTLGFISGKYEACLTLLEALKPRMRRDIYLGRFVGKLCDSIADRMILQYFTPYKAVDMVRMAAALGLSYEQLEKALAALIADGRMAARIDSQSRTLYRSSEDDRGAMVDRVLGLTKVHAACLKRDMLRLSLMQHDLSVEPAFKGPNTRSKGSPREGGGGGEAATEGPSSGGTSSAAGTAAGGGDIFSTVSNVFNFLGGGGATVGDHESNQMDVEYGAEEDDHEDMDD